MVQITIMKLFAIALVVFMAGIIAFSGCTSQDNSMDQRGHAVITVNQLDVIMLVNESGGNCFIAGLYQVSNVGEIPIVDEKVLVELVDVQTGEKVDSTNISVICLPPGSSGNYTVRFDHLECVEKYSLVAPLQKDFYRK